MGKVLVVDDDEQVIQQFKNYLASFGHDALFLLEPGYLFDMLEIEDVELILMDVHMPHVNGTELLRQLKTHDTFHHIPVIMLTADTKEQILAHCLELGAIDFLTKDIGEIAIKARIQSALTLSSYIREIEELNTQLEALATIDGLTQLRNRRYFMQQLETEHSKALRYQTPFSLILFDIDHFKKFNDTHGHQCGDEVLKVVSDVTKQTLRKSDIAARYGGEEFIILLPQSHIKQAESKAELLRSSIEKAQTEWNGKTLSVTVSVGVSQFNLSETMSLEELIQQADQALYQAKEKGRNMVCLSS